MNKIIFASHNKNKAQELKENAEKKLKEYNKIVDPKKMTNNGG